MATPIDSPSSAAIDAVAKRVEPWKVLVAIGVTLVTGGAAFAGWSSSLASESDIRAVRSAVTADLDALHAEQQALSLRTARTETDLAWLKSTMYEVAQRVGAVTVPPPPP